MTRQEDVIRAAFDNLSIQPTLATNKFTPSSQLDRTDPQYAVRLPISLLIEGIDVLVNDMNDALPSSEPITSSRLAEASDVLQHAITKFVLFLSRDPDTTIAAKESDNLSRAITNVVCMLRCLLGSAGTTQATAIVALGTSMLSRLRAAILQLQHVVLSGVTLDAHLTGIVWDACKQLSQQTPTTNAQAVGKQLMQQLAMIKDAKAELSEIKLASSEVLDQDNDDDSNDDDDDDFDDAIELDADQFKIVPPTIEMISFAFSMTRLIYSLTLKGSKEGESQPIVDWMENALTMICAVTQSIDVIGAGIDASDALQSLRSPYHQLITQLQSLIQHIPKHPRFADVFITLLDTKDRGEPCMSQIFNDVTCASCGCSLSADQQREQASKPEFRFLNNLHLKVHRLHNELGIDLTELQIK